MTEENGEKEMKEEGTSPDICISGEFIYVRELDGNILPIKVPEFEYILVSVSPSGRTLTGRMAIWTGKETLWIYVHGVSLDLEEAARSWNLDLEKDPHTDGVYILRKKKEEERTWDND